MTAQDLLRQEAAPCRASTAFTEDDLEFLKEANPKPIMGIFGPSRKEIEAAYRYAPNPTWDAGFATEQELAAAGVFKDKFGIIAGHSWQKNTRIFYNPEPGQMKPIITFGGMGSLKTTSFHIHFSLQWKGSLIIIEMTGETSITTLHHRQKFQPVSMINPTNAFSEYLKGIPNRRFNPLARYWLNPRMPRLLEAVLGRSRRDARKSKAAGISIGITRPEDGSKQ